MDAHISLDIVGPNAKHEYLTATIPVSTSSNPSDELLWTRVFTNDDIIAYKEWLEEIAAAGYVDGELA